MPRKYNPAIDYRSYAVGEKDRPLLTTNQTAQKLGLTTTQGVRSLVKAGRLPAKHVDRRCLVPEWAVQGRKEHREQTLGRLPTDRSDDTYLRTRVTSLEDSLVALRAASEHERRAHAHQQDALREWSLAYNILHEAVGAIVVPSTAQRLDTDTHL